MIGMSIMMVSKIKADIPNPFIKHTQYESFKNIFFPRNANLINALFQDKYGMMWVGTNFGLFSYDGYKVQEYGDKSKSIFAIIQFDEMRLCMATDRGITFFNLFTEQFEPIPNVLKNIGAVRSIALFDNILWIGTQQSGLLAYHLENKSLDKIPIQNTTNEQTIIYSLIEAEGMLYIGSYEGLSYYNPKLKQRIEIILPEKDKMVNSLFWDKNTSAVWVGTEGSLFRYDLYSRNIEYQKDLPVNSFKSISVDALSNIVLGTDNGIYVYNPLTKIYKKTIHDSRNTQSLCNDVIWCIFRDNSDNLWFGTDHGLALASAKSAYKFIHISELTNSGEGNRFSVVKIDSRGNYWLGGVNGLLLLKNKNIGYDVMWFKMESKKYPLLHNRIRSVYEDNEGEIWIATDGGVARYNRNKEQFQYYHITDKSGKLNTKWAYGIYEDNMERLWISSYMGGLFIINKKELLSNVHTSNSFIADINLSSKEDFSIQMGNIVSQILADNSGRIWINTQQDGLVSVQSQNLQVSKKRIFLNEMIYDGERYLWYASLNRLYRMDISSNEPQLIKQHREANQISGLSLQGKKLWYICDEDIYELNTYNFTTKRIATPNYSLQSVYYDKHNNIYLWGGEDGLLCLFASSLEFEREQNPIKITSIWANGNRLLPEGIDYNGENVRFRHKIELPYSYKNLFVDFSTFSYSTDIDSSFYYQLNTSDTTWYKLEVGQNRISFGQLPIGNNILKLRQGGNNRQITSFEIMIMPPWYASTWAYLIYTIAFMLIIGGFIYSLKIKYRKKVERIEKEKSLSLSILKMDFFTNIAHELKTPLTLIIAPISNLINEIRNIEHRKSLLLIQKNAIRLNQLISKILDFKKIEIESDDRAIRSNVEICSFVHNLIDNFSTQHKQKNIHLDFSTNIEKLWMKLDVFKIESALTNLIANATKFIGANGGRIELSLMVDVDKLKIEITDNGKGIDKKDIPYLFVRFFQSSNNPKEINGTGIGLYLAQKYIKLHNGNIEIRSEGINKGTKVIIELPLSGDNLINYNIEDRSHNTHKERDKLPKLLIIDDNAEIVAFLENTLSKHYCCLTAYNGSDGLSMAYEHIPDVIIVDQMMPEMDGIKVCKAIRKYQPTATIPILMLTAKDEMDTRINSLKAGVDIFIPKPFDTNILILHLSQLLQSHSRLKEQIRIETIQNNPIENARIELSPDEIYLNRIVGIIEDNLDNSDFNVTMLNQLAQTETKQLYRKIKQLTGLSPIEFIKKIRLKKAAILLSKNGFTVSEVMYLVGYTNASYFTKCFVAEFGITPSVYREKTI